MTLQSDIINKIKENIRQKEESLEFFLKDIIVSDNEKVSIQQLIDDIDASILEDINAVNQKLTEKKEAYQDRIDSGCKTDLFWRVVGITTEQTTIATRNGSVPGPVYTNYTLECVRISPNGYPPIVVRQPTAEDLLSGYINTALNKLFGIKSEPIDDGTTLEYVTPSGIQKTNIKSLLQIEEENLFGLKYYDEPYTKDLGDTFVASFPGKIGVGKTTLTALTIALDDLSDIKLGNIVVCNKSGVFPAGVTTIVGIGTTLGNINFEADSVQGSGVASVSNVGVGSIITITITDGGYGYSQTDPPPIIIESPGNKVAIATAVVSIAGTISKLTLSDPGIGYSIAPTVEISSPFYQNAIGIGSTGGTYGGVVGIVTIDPGFGYKTAPTLIFQNPTTYTFNTTSDINSAADTIQIPSHPYVNGTRLLYQVGAGNTESFGLTNNTVYYVVGATQNTIQLSTSFGGGAVGLTTIRDSINFNAATVNPTLDELYVTSSPYSNGEPVYYENNGNASVGGLNNNQLYYASTSIGSTVIKLYQNSSLTTVADITSTSTGTHRLRQYISLEYNSVRGITAQGTCTVLSGFVTSTQITESGSGYTFDPNITFPHAGIVTATATAQIGASGTVTSLTITNPGAGYTVSDIPLVYFSSPLNETATGQAVVSIGGTVQSITITNPGAGYTTSRIPNVFINPPYEDVLPSFLLKTSALSEVSAPESDGSLVTFTVLLSEDQIDPESWSLPFGTLPFSPQTIGIMDSSNLGIGTYIKYDNSGKRNMTQSWKPELQRDAIKDADGNELFPEIKEPKVGAGKIYYNLGFDFAPITNPANPTSYATEGQKITFTTSAGGGFYGFGGFQFVNGQLVPQYSPQDFVVSCPSCTSTINTNLTNAINAASSAVNSITSQSTQSTLECKIEASNAARIERDSLNATIWGQRGLLGQLISEVKKLKENLKRYESNIGISTYNTGDSTNAGINTAITGIISIGNDTQINCYDN